jgi:hypothetical protein
LINFNSTGQETTFVQPQQTTIAVCHPEHGNVDGDVIGDHTNNPRHFGKDTKEQVKKLKPCCRVIGIPTY